MDFSFGGLGVYKDFGLGSGFTSNLDSRPSRPPLSEQCCVDLRSSGCQRMSITVLVQ